MPLSDTDVAAALLRNAEAAETAARAALESAYAQWRATSDQLKEALAAASAAAPGF